MNNTTATPRERILEVLKNSPDVATARRLLGEIEIREPDASIRIKISQLGSGVSAKLDRMNHVEFIDYRGALALTRGESLLAALLAFGLGTEYGPTAAGKDWGEAPRPLRNGPDLGPNVELDNRGKVNRKGRHDADEALSTLIAEKILAGMPRPEAPVFTVNVPTIEEGAIAKAVTRALETLVPQKADREALEVLNRWKIRAGANEARAERLARIVGAWSAASQTTRDNIHVWDSVLGGTLADADHADKYRVTEAEIHADADKSHAPTPEVIEDRRRLNQRAGEEAFKPTHDIEGTAKDRREAAAEHTLDGMTGRETREAIQRANGVTFKGEDLDAIQKLLAVYCYPGHGPKRIKLSGAWPDLDEALDVLVAAYQRATA